MWSRGTGLSHKAETKTHLINFQCFPSGHRASPESFIKLIMT